MVAKARLDADRKAQPKARIIKHVKQGDCVGPRTHSDSLEFREAMYRCKNCTTTNKQVLRDCCSNPDWEPFEEKIPLKRHEDKSQHIPYYRISCTRWLLEDWTATHPSYSIVGKGETADKAIQDWRDRYNKRF